MSDSKPFAFVLMPFGSEFDDIYQFGIKRPCEECGVHAERVDEQFYSESMLGRIYRQIENADFIIAEMTGRNPNVFYEVGYAHAKDKLCTLITKEADSIPFDLQHHYHVVHGGSIKDLQDKLAPRIEWMKGEVAKRSKEKIKVSVTAGLGDLNKDSLTHTGSFDLDIFLKNLTSERSPEIDNIFITASSSWTVRQNGKRCVSEEIEGDRQKIFISPASPRLGPNALSQTTINFSKHFWVKWSGEEMKEDYNAKGNIIVEVATSEGVLNHDFDISVDFSEIPF